MKVGQWIVVAVLLLLVVAVGMGYFATREDRPAKSSANDQVPLVDETPLKTANRVALLAATPDEKRVAEEAARVADHESRP